jgi:hypothetical protein
MWQERRICHKRGKRDVPVENVARETLTWQERRQRGKRDVNVARPTLSGKSIFTNVARTTYMSQTWQERRSGGKRGKRDVNVARETSTWQERHQRGKTDVIGQYDFFFFNFLYFATIWTILSITPQIKRRNFYNMY